MNRYRVMYTQPLLVNHCSRSNHKIIISKTYTQQILFMISPSVQNECLDGRKINQSNIEFDDVSLTCSCFESIDNHMRRYTELLMFK